MTIYNAGMEMVFLNYFSHQKLKHFLNGEPTSESSPDKAGEFSKVL